MKGQLDRVFADFERDEIEIRWRPYQLYPGIPRDGLDRAAHLRRRYGESTDLGRIPSGIQAAARELGLQLNFSKITRIPNTLKAHGLMDLAFEAGFQHGLAQVLFEYHFIEGRDVGDSEELICAAGSVGIDEVAARSFLTSNKGDPEVLAQLERARKLDIVGVPCILIEERFRIPGAQGMDSLAAMLRRARQKLAEELSQA